MEHNAITREEKIQIAMLIAIFILIMALIVAIVLFSKNVELIKTNPIQYSIDKTELTSCTCFTETGQSVRFGDAENIFSFIET